MYQNIFMLIKKTCTYLYSKIKLLRFSHSDFIINVFDFILTF